MLHTTRARLLGLPASISLRQASTQTTPTRPVSTSTTTDTSAAASKTTLSDSPSDSEVRNIPDTTKLPWNDFLHLRKQRHRAELVASVPTAALGFLSGFGYFATLEIDPSQLVLGLDPLIVYGGATVACGGLGWLLGPTVGGTMWKLAHRKKQHLIEAREREFYEHVKRNRVDPSKQSFNNPVPDHYAEKIGSIKDYRRWLRDCRAYNRKANWGGAKGDLKP
ncbi:TIM23 complex component [Savitreella phatthalungensis]